MKKNKLLKFILSKPLVLKILLSLILFFASLGFIFLSKPLYFPPLNSDLESFSSVRALSHIKSISNSPHYHTLYETSSNLSEGIKNVRKYIKNTLEELDVTTYTNHYPKGTRYISSSNFTDPNPSFFEDVLNYDILNYLVEFKGESDTSILLSAHYDSAPPSYYPTIYHTNGTYSSNKEPSLGAADDGYGVGTILEIIRLLKIQSENHLLKNTVKLLLNDGEELGYVGVKLELQKHPEYYKDVSFVINLESRGTRGNAIMFETVKTNSRIIKLYNKGKYKFANSFSSYLVPIMFSGGTYTDFGVYTKNSFVGVGFSNVNSFDDYHSARDNYNNTSITTIAQLGNEVYPMVLEFVNNSLYSDINYFKTGEETIFFTILPNILIVLNIKVSYLLMSLLALLVFGLLILKIIKEHISIKKIFITTISILLLVFTVFGICTLYEMLVGYLSNVKFSLINMYGISRIPYFFCVILLLLIFILLIYILNLKKIKSLLHEVKISVIFLLLVLST
ncbi:MAG: M28 family peptidase, partial [Acholeplasmatales bacterium]|nr:M28 family peptidase [Acholeplasmatales bacterium]